MTSKVEPIATDCGALRTAGSEGAAGVGAVTGGFIEPVAVPGAIGVLGLGVLAGVLEGRVEDGTLGGVFTVGLVAGFEAVLRWWDWGGTSSDVK